MTSDDEHSELMVAWTSVHGLLDRMTSSLNWTDVQYLDVTEMADRGRGLASHLQGAVTLSRDFRYDSGFALLRTALEQVVVDWLVFLSRTYKTLCPRRRHHVGGMEIRQSKWSRLDVDHCGLGQDEKGRCSNRPFWPGFRAG